MVECPLVLLLDTPLINTLMLRNDSQLRCQSSVDQSVYIEAIEGQLSVDV